MLTVIFWVVTLYSTVGCYHILEESIASIFSIEMDISEELSPLGLK